MLVDLQHALSPEDLGTSVCGVCDQEFEIETVVASAATNGRDDVGVICPDCVAYLGTRSEKCPTIELYNELLEQYPAPRWATDEAMQEHMDNLAYDYESQSEIYESARLFKGFDQS